MKNLIAKVVDGQNLTMEEAGRAMDMMLEGSATQAQMASFLTALRMKGETVDEIEGSARAMQARGGSVHPKSDHYIDFVGTGGDGANTFNISTTASIIAAACGVVIAKHGNRASSSKSGAADVLEALGAEIMLPPEKVEQCVNEVGFGFMMAQVFHKSMKNVASVRTELGIRTLFNMLGPLSNPGRSKAQVIGVYEDAKVRVFSKVMSRMGVTRAMIICGNHGMDEITTTGKTLVNEIDGEEIKEYYIDPADYGIAYATLDDIKGGTGADNAEIAKRIYAGEKGPARDIVLMNAGAAVYIAGLADSYADGIKKAAEAVDSGKAAAKLEEFVNKTKELAKA